MRKDENGEECPATLGEYLDICNTINPNCQAVAFLQRKIDQSTEGRDSLVLAADSQMRYLLYPLLVD